MSLGTFDASPFQWQHEGRVCLPTRAALMLSLQLSAAPTTQSPLAICQTVSEACQLKDLIMPDSCQGLCSQMMQLELPGAIAGVETWCSNQGFAGIHMRLGSAFLHMHTCQWCRCGNLCIVKLHFHVAHCIVECSGFMVAAMADWTRWTTLLQKK